MRDRNGEDSLESGKKLAIDPEGDVDDALEEEIQGILKKDEKIVLLQVSCLSQLWELKTGATPEPKLNGTL